jgi:hypothetical protein
VENLVDLHATEMVQRLKTAQALVLRPHKDCCHPDRS